MKIITLCGSMRYHDRFLKYHNELIMQGFICFLPRIQPKKDSKPSPIEIKILHTVHDEKISLSDAILVIGEHVGDDTQREIDYAKLLGKMVFYEAEFSRIKHLI